VLASRVIAATKDSKRGSLIFLYCRHQDKSRNSLAAMLKALLAQLLRVNPEVLSFIYEECAKSSELTLESLEPLKKLAEYALEGTQPIWIILDGLDECDKKEKKKILTWITAIVKSEDPPGRLRVLIVSQDEGDIRKSLTKRPSISLHDAPQHHEAIRAYATRKSIKLRQKFELSGSTERDIINIVTARSNGELASLLNIGC
jgi:hypothetical protein